MSRPSSGIRFLIDATEGESRRLCVGIEINGPFTASTLTVHFPRWVPGSYFLREPIQHMTDFVATDQSGNILSASRKDVDAMRIKVSPETTSVMLTYRLLATDLSVRGNHLDTTHLHMMPPFTWFMPTEGIDSARMNMEHVVELHAPKGWTPATQYTDAGNKTGKGELTANQGTTHCFTSPQRDEFLDAIKAEKRMWSQGKAKANYSHRDVMATATTTYNNLLAEKTWKVPNDDSKVKEEVDQNAKFLALTDSHSHPIPPLPLPPHHIFRTTVTDT